MAQDALQLAVLIGADNASAAVTKQWLEEVAKYAVAAVMRAYGDWTTQNLVGWKERLHRHAIQLVQQFACTTGENSTDSACIVDAMDLLYAGNVAGFCLVSSDSDFTRLATSLRGWEGCVCVRRAQDSRRIHRRPRPVHLHRGAEATGHRRSTSGTCAGARRPRLALASVARHRGTTALYRLCVTVRSGLLHRQKPRFVRPAELLLQQAQRTCTETTTISRRQGNH